MAKPRKRRGRGGCVSGAPHLEAAVSEYAPLLVLLDDRRGRQVAGVRGLIAATTGGLAIEMVAVAYLTADQVFAVHEAAYRNPARPGFERLVAESRP